MHLVIPKSFNDAQQVADKFKDGIPVVLNLQSTDTDLSKRLIDFGSGLTYALDGCMQRIADKVFMLTPRDVEISAEERAQLVQALRRTPLHASSGMEPDRRLRGNHTVARVQARRARPLSGDRDAVARRPAQDEGRAEGNGRLGGDAARMTSGRAHALERSHAARITK